MASVESFVCWETKKERQQHVATLHSRGVSQTNCAHRLKVSRQTILRDYKELGLTTWSDVSDETLEKHVRTIMAVEHDAVGLHKIESHLLQRFGLRIQEKRIRGAMVSELQVLICQFSSQATLLSPLMPQEALGYARGQPRKVRQRKCYATKGPDFTHSLDQNEKLGMYGFKILSSIDVYSRYPVRHKV
jgi:hypothetical protein